MEEDDNGDKTEEPSSHRIEEFREKGMIASSKEVISIVVLTFSIIGIIFSSAYIFEMMTEYIQWISEIDPRTIYVGAKFKDFINRTMVVLLKCCAPIMLTSALFGILAHVMQFGMLFSPNILGIKFERINPIKGLERIFSMKSIVEALKSFLKFLIIFLISYYFLKKEMPSITGFYQIELIQCVIYGKVILGKLSFSILFGLTFVAIIDFSWEKYSYRQKLLQTKQQAKQETKEREGNPEIKQKIRLIQREMSKKRMMSEIPKADVIITNPTHISVAIKYDVSNMVAPKVIAKGEDFMALQIRELAKNHDIPMVENVPLARTLYRTVKVGEVVPRDLYKAIAEILAFVYKLKKKKKAIE